MLIPFLRLHRLPLRLLVSLAAATFLLVATAWGAEAEAPVQPKSTPSVSPGDGSPKTSNWWDKENEKKKERLQNNPWRGEIWLGAHLAVPNPQLRRTSDLFGLGFGFGAGFAPRRWPVLFGLDFGLTGFWPRQERFVFDGMDTYWDIKRRSFWVLPTLRLLPPSNMVIRPHLGIMGGIWGHEVVISPSDDFQDHDNRKLGADIVGAYGFTAGLSTAIGEKGALGLTLMHLRAKGIAVPNQNDVWITDGRLHFSKNRTAGIHQWVLSLVYNGALW